MISSVATRGRAGPAPSRHSRRTATQAHEGRAVERRSMTTTLAAPEARTSVVERTRLRALTLQLEFVLRNTTNLETWLPQITHRLNASCEVMLHDRVHP